MNSQSYGFERLAALVGQHVIVDFSSTGSRTREHLIGIKTMPVNVDGIEISWPFALVFGDGSEVPLNDVTAIMEGGE